MVYVLIVFVCLAFIFVWLKTKTARPDGEYIGREIHPYRRMMPIIMPTKAESLVYMEMSVDASKLTNFVARSPYTVTHVLVATAGHVLHTHGRINRFVAGGRLYRRRGVWVTFSAKRQKLNDRAKLATIKLELPKDAPLGQVAGQIDAVLEVERSDKDTYLDKELSLFLRLPHFALQVAQKLMSWANDHHLLPASFIKNDSLFTGVVIANLGSLGMGTATHHLYEWGNCPLFLVVGTAEPRVVPGPGGQPCVKSILPMTLTFDERIEDGLTTRAALDDMRAILEDPEAFFGGKSAPAQGA